MKEDVFGQKYTRSLLNITLSSVLYPQYQPHNCSNDASLLYRLRMEGTQRLSTLTWDTQLASGRAKTERAEPGGLTLEFRALTLDLALSLMEEVLVNRLGQMDP